MTTPQSGPSATSNRLGILFVSMAMMLFVVNDTLMKKIAESLPLPQVIVVRGMVAIVLIVAVILATSNRAVLLKIADRRVVLRSVADALGGILYLAALVHLPLANATAINLSSPLMIAVLAAVVLGERSNAGRWVAIAAGFAGVLLIAQPAAEGFSAWSWVCLAATLSQAIRDLLTRTIHSSVPSQVVSLGNAMCITLFGLVWTATSSWLPMRWDQIGWMTLSAVLVSSGYLLMIRAIRIADMSVVAPFRYVGLLTAVGVGWLVWRQIPNGLATAGIVLVVLAGMCLLHEQRRVASTQDSNKGDGPRTR